MQFAARSKPARAVVGLCTVGVLLASLGSCGSADDNPAATEPVVDLARLDVGNYPTRPRQIGTVKNLEQARLIEAERLGNFVPAPSDIDPNFTHPSPFIATVFIDPEAALGKIMAVDRFAEAAPDFVAGFVSTAGSEPTHEGVDLFNAVMVFPDEQNAAKCCCRARTCRLRGQRAESADLDTEIPNGSGTLATDRIIGGILVCHRQSSSCSPGSSTNSLFANAR